MKKRTGAASAGDVLVGEVSEGAADVARAEARPDPAAAGPSLKSGTVEGAADDYLSVRLGARRALARRAVSCLVEPQTGDRVLCSLEGEEVFVLAVLEREAAGPTVISAAGDVEIAAGGTFTVTAPAGLHLATARDMTLTATRLESVADEASLVWKVARLATRALTADLGRAEVTAEESTSIVGRVVQRARRVYRMIEGTETVRAGQVDVVAETGLRMHGQTAVVTAGDLVKVDGKQIQLG